MRASAGLHPDVIWYLKHVCTPAEAADFHRQPDRVRDNPIGQSEVFYDPAASRYVLRRFSFGSGVEKIAIFYYDGIVVRVLKCRQAKPRRLRRPRDPDAPGEA
jgi:hypothetical protein